MQASDSLQIVSYFCSKSLDQWNYVVVNYILIQVLLPRAFPVFFSLRLRKRHIILHIIHTSSQLFYYSTLRHVCFLFSVVYFFFSREQIDFRTQYSFTSAGNQLFQIELQLHESTLQRVSSSPCAPTEWNLLFATLLILICNMITSFIER